MTLEQFRFFNGHLIEINMKLPTRVEAGGQGVFVKLLSECLTKMAIEHKILYFCDKEQPLEIKHIVVRVDNNLFLGSKGAQCGPLYAYKDLVTREVTFEELKTAVNDPDEWSPVFDRSLIPDMEKMFDNIPFEFGYFLAGERDYEEILYNTPISTLNDHTKREVQKENSMEAVRNLNKILGGLDGSKDAQVIKIKRRRQKDDDEDGN